MNSGYWEVTVKTKDRKRSCSRGWTWRVSCDGERKTSNDDERMIWVVRRLNGKWGQKGEKRMQRYALRIRRRI